MLEVLSTNRDLQQLVKEESKMITQIRYSDLPSYDLGIEKGMEKGEAKLFLRMVESRLGSLPTNLLTQVNEANSEQLEKWSLRLFTAKTIDELFSNR